MGRPRRLPVATTFQAKELRNILRAAPPELEDCEAWREVRAAALAVLEGADRGDLWHDLAARHNQVLDDLGARYQVFNNYGVSMTRQLGNVHEYEARALPEGLAREWVGTLQATVYRWLGDVSGPRSSNHCKTCGTVVMGSLYCSDACRKIFTRRTEETLSTDANGQK